MCSGEATSITWNWNTLYHLLVIFTCNFDKQDITNRSSWKYYCIVSMFVIAKDYWYKSKSRNEKVNHSTSLPLREFAANTLGVFIVYIHMDNWIYKLSFFFHKKRFIVISSKPLNGLSSSFLDKFLLIFREPRYVTLIYSFPCAALRSVSTFWTAFMYRSWIES